MIAFWIALVAGVAVAIVYIGLGVQAFLRVRRDVLSAAASGEPDDLSTDELGDAGTFTWKAIGALAGSTAVIALLGVSPVFWYLPAVLAVGSAVAVVLAFLIDRRSVEA
ncbi:hypothetical protein [Mycobacterium sp. 3519A]|jgi:hypothetical protein|uniref:hypothetical protein n=1 Tax=Mycobacterium sp. 3519A TaxID=2057184 RepID=UPI000C79F605|nr:hypothetical protein [Mycobacterium sp. 3519A]